MKPISDQDVVFSNNKEVIVKHESKKTIYFIYIKEGEVKNYRSKMSKESLNARVYELKRMREPASKKSFEESQDEIEDINIPKEN
jgi:hypothetical protein